VVWVNGWQIIHNQKIYVLFIKILVNYIFLINYMILVKNIEILLILLKWEHNYVKNKLVDLGLWMIIYLVIRLKKVHN
jgi:hypothetical protein